MNIDAWKKLGYLPASDVARLLGVAPISVYRHLDSGKLQGGRQGKFRFVTRDSFTSYVRDTFTDARIVESILSSIDESPK